MCDFNWKQYLSNYQDLRLSGIVTQRGARKHYEQLGRKENRTDKLQIGKNIVYSIEGYKNLINSTNSTKNIFKTSWHFRDQIPEEIAKCLEITKYLNPNYTVYYFDNIEMEQSIKDISNEYHKCWLKLVPGAYKADLWRYVMLYTYGGIYSDIGHEPKVSYDNIIEEYDMVLIKEAFNGGIHNGFMYCKQGNNFMKRAIEQIISNVNQIYYGTTDTDITGPVMLQKIYKENEYSVKWLFHNFSKYLLIPEQATINGNDGNNILIYTKFSNYYNIMYNNITDYHVLWNNKKIYN